MCVYLSACVCEREREKENEGEYIPTHRKPTDQMTDRAPD